MKGYAALIGLLFACVFHGTFSTPNFGVPELFSKGKHYPFSTGGSLLAYHGSGGQPDIGPYGDSGNGIPGYGEGMADMTGHTPGGMDSMYGNSFGKPFGGMDSMYGNSVGKPYGGMDSMYGNTAEKPFGGMSSPFGNSVGKPFGGMDSMYGNTAEKPFGGMSSPFGNSASQGPATGFPGSMNPGLGGFGVGKHPSGSGGRPNGGYHPSSMNDGGYFEDPSIKIKTLERRLARCMRAKAALESILSSRVPNNSGNLVPKCIGGFCPNEYDGMDNPNYFE